MTNAEARFSVALRPRKPEGSLGRTAQDGHLDSHTAPELWNHYLIEEFLKKTLEPRFWDFHWATLIGNISHFDDYHHQLMRTGTTAVNREEEKNKKQNSTQCRRSVTTSAGVLWTFRKENNNDDNNTRPKHNSNKNTVVEKRSLLQKCLPRPNWRKF